MNWIFGRAHKDFFALYAAGLVALIFLILTQEGSRLQLAILFISFVIIDTGHGYVTAWRAFRHPTAQYAKRHGLSFILIFLLSWFWMYTQIPYFWTMVVYFTIYHHIRQFFGWNRWYQNLNKRACAASDYFLYGLLLIPIVLFHFRPKLTLSIYGTGEVIFWPNQNAFYIGLGFYVIFVLSWLIYEFTLWRKGIKELNRFSALFIPTAFHSYCFLYATDLYQIVLPLLSLHGVAYIAVMSQSLQRLNNYKKSWLYFSFLLFVTALMGGLFEYWIEDFAVEYDYLKKNLGALVTLANAAIVAPALWHYLVDGWIWKRTDPEAVVVFSPQIRQ